MAKSIKLKNNIYWDSSNIIYRRNNLNSILKNYLQGASRKDTVVNSYVRLFTFEISAIWKSASILFYLDNTQNDDFSQLINFSVKKNKSEDEIFLKTFKALNFSGDLSSQLVAVTTSTNVIEVYFKMNASQSPTINILTISKFMDADNFGKVTIDCNTVLSDLPNGTQKFVKNIFQ